MPTAAYYDWGRKAIPTVAFSSLRCTEPFSFQLVLLLFELVEYFVKGVCSASMGLLSAADCGQSMGILSAADCGQSMGILSAAGMRGRDKVLKTVKASAVLKRIS